MNAIRSWWQKMGRTVYGGAYHLLVTADGGGSNGSRTRLWKWELQRFANRTGLTITVCHYPPGSDDQMKQLHLQRHEFHADWNYTIRPRKADLN